MRIVTYCMVIAWGLTLAACYLPTADAGEFDGPIVTDVYPDQLSDVVTAWQEVTGETVTDYCVDEIGSVPVYAVDAIPERCLATFGEKVAACCIVNVDDLGNWDAITGLLAYRPEREKRLTMVHEYIHLIEWCEWRTSDPRHANQRLWREFGSGTVESVARIYTNSRAYP
jgi:hypothetical protein